MSLRHCSPWRDLATQGRDHPRCEGVTESADDCEPCGRSGQYNVERLMAEHGDAKMTVLLQTLADRPKARSASIYDRCRRSTRGLRYARDCPRVGVRPVKSC